MIVARVQAGAAVNESMCMMKFLTLVLALALPIFTAQAHSQFAPVPLKTKLAPLSRAGSHEAS